MWKNLKKQICNGYKITRDEIDHIIASLDNQSELFNLLNLAYQIRLRFKGNKVHLCSIVNAKSGNCTENCAFCSQSSLSKAKIDTYPFIGGKKIDEAFNKAKKSGAHGFSVVVSGRSIEKEECMEMAEVIKAHKGDDLYFCASLGELDKPEIRSLRDSGLKKLHHNLETSRNYFPSICSTHSYDDKIRTILSAKEENLKVCSGGIFGLGESWKDRADLAFELRELVVDSIPINFLNPIEGTALENSRTLPPLEALAIIALFRLILSDRDIVVCGGREITLRDLQSWIFYAGANGMMIGGYLTTSGRDISQDMRMIKDLGLEV
ncbi:MAG: biotin synthase BioB [bacterium]